MSRLCVIFIGALGSLTLSDAALAQLTIAPTAAAQRDAAMAAPANSNLRRPAQQHPQPHALNLSKIAN